MRDMGQIFKELGIDPIRANPEEIREIAAGYGITFLDGEEGDGEAVAFAGDIRRMHEVSQLCRSCSGLESCETDPVGYEFVVSRDGRGNLHGSLRACPRRKQYEERTHAESVLASCKIPLNLRSKGFRDFDPSDNPEGYRVAAEIVKGTATKGAVFYGPTGVGKTHLAAAVLNNRIIAGKSGVYVSVPDFMDDLRAATRSDDPDRIRDARSVVIETDFLFLDDLGAEKPSEFVIEELFKIINGRLLERRMTIVTTNLDPDALKLYYEGFGGSRIFSRLSEACEWVKMSGRDRRI